MKITIIYDNTSARSDLQADWDNTGGLSSFLHINNQIKLWIPSYFSGAKDAKEFIEVKNPRKLYEGIHSTGELDGIEQSLCIETEKGIVIIAGCSHPRMGNIIKTASKLGKVYGIIGGLHGTRPESLKDLDLICPTHCTQYKLEIKFLYPEKYVEGGAGKIIEVEQNESQNFNFSRNRNFSNNSNLVFNPN